MHIDQKCHENVWILSGTADGPILANKLLELNFIVFVSVISYRASQAYEYNNKLHIFTGILRDEEEIADFAKNNQIDRVIDATHPFAINISQKLIKVCKKNSLPLVRFERYANKQIDKRFKVIPNLKGINDVELKNKNLLLAIGSRSLDNTARFYMDLGANVFARILSTPESVSSAFASSIANSNLAILNPSKLISNNLEMHICKYWSIDYILCRDSGGYSQRLWEKISLSLEIKLFLSRRPVCSDGISSFATYDGLVDFLNSKKLSVNNHE